MYIDELFYRLRKSGLGCRNNQYFYGCLGYADDLLLLSGSRSGLQAMVKICESFAKQKSLKFSTNSDPVKSKTKCVIFTSKANERKNVAPIILNSDLLPWVNDVKHLGNILQSDNSMKKDISVKRGRFIGSVNSLLQEFYFAEPTVLVHLLKVYCCSFYGCTLWNIYSAEVDRIYKSWNVSIRTIFNVPFKTHRYFIEPLSSCCHPKSIISSRYIKFVDSLLSCSKANVSFLARLNYRDNRTTMGKCLSKISREMNVSVTSLWRTTRESRRIQYFPVPADETWRIKAVLELIMARR